MIATSAPRHSETSRQLVHIAMGAFALLLRWLPWWQAVVLATAALAFNLLVLPRVGARLYRPGDRERGVHGIVLYPLAILSLLLVFPARPDIVAAAWGILAAGDGLATLAGRAIGGRKWPWNREKTISGSVAFAAGGAAAGVFLAWWCRPATVPPPSMLFSIAAPIAAAIVAALVETVPVRLDDNLSVAAASGATLWVASLASIDRLPAAIAIAGDRLPAALVLNVGVAFAGYRARTVTITGAVVGALIGAVIYLSTGWQGWVLLLITFVAASVASRLGLTRKVLLGIAEERGGRRGAGNAIANTGVAAVAAAVALTAADADLARLAFDHRPRRGRQRYDCQRDRQGVGTPDVVDHVAGASAARHLRGDVARRHGGGDRRRGRTWPGRDRVGAGPAFLPVDRGGLGNRGRAARELARRDARSARYPEQRHAELHQHCRRGVDRRSRRHLARMKKLALLLEFSRPFTLLAPALGFASGAATAYGAQPREAWSLALVLYPVIGLTMAAVLNAASNALNQIYDLEIDRINKPKRPLADGRLSMREAWQFTWWTYGIALLLAWLVAPGGRHECFWIVLIATVITVLYSVPPARTKRLGIWANVTIAIPRGVLLKVAGWSAVKTVMAVGALVHRRNLRPLPAGRVHDQGLRRHGRGRPRRLPHAADHLWGPPRRLDDLAVVRGPVRHDRHRRLVGHSHWQLHPAADRSRW